MEKMTGKYYIDNRNKKYCFERVVMAHLELYHRDLYRAIVGYQMALLEHRKQQRKVAIHSFTLDVEDRLYNRDDGEYTEKDLLSYAGVLYLQALLQATIDTAKEDARCIRYDLKGI